MYRTIPTQPVSDSKGMTLIEMMVVVIILSVLTTLGVSGYRKLVYQARNAEAYQFLGAIKATQSAHFQTFGEYVGNEDWAEWPPGQFPLDNRIPWGDASNDEIWRNLAKPSGPVWFKYRVRSSVDPQRAPANIFRPLPDGPWFQAQARGDFNGDGETSLLEITSTRSSVFVENLNE
jgi:prepilin-type N-terminal cleavage/methylation domain-containing protein